MDRQTERCLCRQWPDRHHQSNPNSRLIVRSRDQIHYMPLQMRQPLLGTGRVCLIPRWTLLRGRGRLELCLALSVSIHSSHNTDHSTSRPPARANPSRPSLVPIPRSMFSIGVESSARHDKYDSEHGLRRNYRTQILQRPLCVRVAQFAVPSMRRGTRIQPCAISCA